MDVTSFILGFKKGAASGTGGSSDGEKVFLLKEGTIYTGKGSNSSMIIEHGMGVVPDIVVFYLAAPLTDASDMPLYTAIGYSDKMLAAIGGGYKNGFSYVNANLSIASMYSNLGIEHDALDELRNAVIRNATGDTFTVGSSNRPISSKYAYKWVAIGNVL